jgi:hypothetical protein
MKREAEERRNCIIEMSQKVAVVSYFISGDGQRRRALDDKPIQGFGFYFLRLFLIEPLLFSNYSDGFINQQFARR